MDVAKICKAQGVTPEQLAKGLGVRIETVHRWMTGAKKPSRIALFAIEHFLKEQKTDLSGKSP